MAADTAFLELVHNHTASEALYNIDDILTVGGGAPEFSPLVYQGTKRGASMFQGLLEFATELGNGVLGIGKKLLKLGENVLDLALLLTETDPSCGVGIVFLCKIGATLRWVGIAAGGALLLGVGGFIIYKSVNASQAAAKAKAAASAMSSTTEKEVKRGRARRDQKYSEVSLSEN